MIREELELVTDEGSLRSGDLCVAKRCCNCGRSHRFMLLNMVGPAGKTFLPGAVVEAPDGATSWDRLPIPECSIKLLFHPWVAIAERRLFRVRTGVETKTVVSVPKALVTQ